MIHTTPLRTPFYTPSFIIMSKQDDSTSPDSDFNSIEKARINSPNYIPITSWKEIERRKTRHAIFQYALGEKFKAPVGRMLKEGAQVLDIQCTAGAWILDMAAAYPKSKFYGVDFYDSKITDDIPENCSFPKCKLDKRLPFDDAVFDYVFVRCCVLAIKKEDLPKLLLELKRVLKPGGYLEWLERDLKIRGGPETRKFSQNMMSTLIQAGFDSRLGNHNHTLLSNAGEFSQTQQNLISIPLGWLWDDVVGRAFANDYRIGLQGSKVPLSEAWGISGEEYDNRLKAMVNEWNHVEKAYVNYRVVVARRSFDHIDIDDPK
ncbi:S-adenosyl-L-methionine-dependent methyltransferase [Endogone sp. FLAS-F59071]|nr:S-adenosyl-L-methionine-dependent methyltransferase [Endogone sp. FLAS-F59071]|eukprot:RUS20414.1 S-adenosyl-L-methionine-dependent methyltransferase [Endogone sp. FLAS-F59071]